MKSPERDLAADAAKSCVIYHPKVWEATLYRSFVVPDKHGRLISKNSHYYEEDSDYELKDLGEGRLVLMGIYKGTAKGWIDEYDSGRPLEEARFVCLAGKDEEGYFVPKKQDIIMQEIYAVGARRAYEIVDILGSSKVPFGNKRYIVFPREDLDFNPPRKRKKKAPKK